MGVIINPDSSYAKQLWPWDHKQGEFYETAGGEIDYTIEGKRPRDPQYFPKMVYKAATTEQGKIICVEPDPPSYLYRDAGEYDHACRRTATQNMQNQRIVKSQAEYDRAKSDGWCDSPPEAIAKYEALQVDIANAAAEANFAVTRMSEKAKAEFKAAGESTDQHVTDVIPQRKRGRPAKGTKAVSA